MSSLWGIHAGKTGDAEVLFLEHRVVALGWEKVGDLSSLPADREAFKERVAKVYGDSKKPGAIPNNAGQLFRFVHEMQTADLVVYTSKSDQQVRIGRVEGGYSYSTAIEAGYPHRRAVTWLKAFPRSQFSQDALNEVGSAMSFFRVKNYAKEFLAALDGKPPLKDADDKILPQFEEEPAKPPAPMEKAIAFKHERTLFKKVDYHLDGLLNYIDIGDIGLPDIQRPFVWSAAKVRDLFDSMYRGFPVGYLLFWANAEIQGAKGIGLGEKQHKVPSLLIVDGQQRLTSLYAVFRGKPVLDDEFREGRIEIAFRPRDGKFEVTDAAIRKDPEFIPDISELWAKGKSSWTLVNEFLKSLEAKKEIDSDDKEAMSHNLDRLFDLQKYPFTALEISSNVSEEAVADIFVRINSEGVKLNQADFILTLLSVFWEEGRFALERFSRDSRRPLAMGAPPSPFNHFIQPGPDQLLRVAIALGFHRGRLKSVYQVLRGKDLETGQFSAERRDQQFARLRTAQEQVLDLKHWHLFLGCLVGAGFRSADMVSSETALLYAYAFYLLGKLQFSVEEHTLQRLIGRWFFATSLAGRYTTSPETAMEADLNRIKDLKTAGSFVEALEKVISSTLTNDFWNITVPGLLETSSARSPVLFAYHASQNRLGAPVLFSDKRLSELLDPTVRATRKAVERHHLFPRAWLEKNGVTNLKLINQSANFAYLEWPDNSDIGEQPPSVYLPEMRKRFSTAAWEKMSLLHALPSGWEALSYAEFLQQRRALIAKLIRRGYEALSAHEDDGIGSSEATAEERGIWKLVESTELALRTLVRSRYVSRWNAGADGQMRKILGDQSWETIERNRSKHASQYPLSQAGTERDVLEYCYLPQLVQLITANGAWDLFQHLFKDKRQLEDLIKSITPVRNDQAHFRAVPTRELQRCGLACDDLAALLAKDSGNSGKTP